MVACSRLSHIPQDVQLLSYMIRGVTNRVERSKTISIVCAIDSVITVGAFERALPGTKDPAPKLDNGEVLFQSSEPAREVSSFPGSFLLPLFIVLN